MRDASGYAPIRDYAVIGDGRSAALIARDGSVDWLCWPNFDSPTICGALLDTGRGGQFVVQPAIPFTARRRYLPDSNVLETVFETERGSVRLVDALLLPDDRLCPMRELARQLEGVSGNVPMRWRFLPRFDYGRLAGSRGWRGPVPVASWGADAVAVCSWGAGAPSWSEEGVGATFALSAGERSLITLVSAYAEPMVFPDRAGVERRTAATIAFWHSWTASLQYEGPWREAVRRSALLLKLLIFAPSGASTAAPTMSLPEEIGGVRNWDYRYCWIRDSSFLIDALLQLGCRAEAQALFWWFMQATALTEPRIQVLYRLDGGPHATERELPLSGYRHSAPVRIGNAAASQLQLDVYGQLLETIWLYAKGEQYRLDRDTGIVVGHIADFVCDTWRSADAGIWEVRGERQHFTHSKVMCWVALDRAIRLAEEREVPIAHLARWKREAAEIAAFVETQCWSDARRSYTRAAGTDHVDANLLMLSLVGFGDQASPRIQGTIDAVSSTLRRGPYVFRYLAEDGLPGQEGCFLNCSFWLAGALARAGRVDEARTLMEELVAQANDVGLYAEEIDPDTNEFLGNFPQGLVHLSLIDAALAIGSALGATPPPRKGDPEHAA